jgi:hypothetical protein
MLHPSVATAVPGRGSEVQNDVRNAGQATKAAPIVEVCDHRTSTKRTQ